VGCTVISEKYPDLMTHEQLKEHTPVCSANDFVCPIKKCGREIKGDQILEHIKKCPFISKTCEKCQVEMPKSKINDHDCFEALKEDAHAKNQEIIKLERDLGVDIEELNLHCI